MIKLEKPQKPKELTIKEENDLTTEFINTGKSVWRKPYIIKPLMIMSSSKCAYCETKVDEESKYVEIEHYHHKDLYKNEVVDWNNLLPSCKKCNGTKGTHDTKAEPLINPCIDDPKNHLQLCLYRIKGTTSLGKLTVSALNLNDPDRLVKPRFAIGNALQDKIEDYIELVDDIIQGTQTSTRRKNIIKNGVLQLLRSGLTDKSYSATYSAILLTTPEYGDLKGKLKQCNLWTDEHKETEDSLINHAII